MSKNKPLKWKVLDPGEVTKKLPREVYFTCMNCGAEALLPVIGLPIAQCDDTIFFDLGPHAIPHVIRCPICKTTKELCK